MAEGIIQRAIAGVKYAITGAAPAEWFGPSQPLAPMAPAEVAGRQYDYPVAFNLNIRPRSEEPVGFAKLKALARNSDILRMVMDGQKDKLEAFDWAIKPREKQGGVRGQSDRSVIEIQAQLEYPDRIHDWAQWLRMLLDQLFVLDAVSIYRRRDLGGRPFSLEVIDGATIKVLLDASGRRPMSPTPAFQQILKGVPAVNYTTEQLLYYPQNVRADHAYGFSRVEQIVDTVEIAIERMKSQKAFFTNGNLPEGFFAGDPSWQPDQLKKIEAYWNALMQPSAENRRSAPFMPGGTEWKDIKPAPLQDTFDEWLARLICFTFSTSPQPFLKQAGMGKGSAESEHAAAEAAGLANIMAYVRRVMNRILIEDFGRPDLEFSWIEDREFDPAVKNEIEESQVRTARMTINEARDRNGEEPIEGGDVPLIFTAAGAIKLSDVIDPPEPEPVPAALVPAIDPNAPPETEPVAPLAKAAAGAAERRLTSAIARLLKKKGAEIGAALGDKLGLAKAASMDDHSTRIDGAFDEIDWNWAELGKAVEPIIAGVATTAGKKAVSDLGLFDKATLSKMTANAEAYAQTRAAEMVGRKLVDGELVENGGWSIPSSTRDMIRGRVADAMEQGFSNEDLAKAIREDEAFSKERATVIARTETANADVQGKLSGWKATGIVAGKEWLAAPDCCDECQAYDGMIVALDEGFPEGDPALHPQCRCDVLPVLSDEMPDADEPEDASDEE